MPDNDAAYECGCMPVLKENRLVFDATMFDFKTGATRTCSVIYQLSERKNGGLYRGSKDTCLPLNYCPSCGSYIGDKSYVQID